MERQNYSKNSRRGEYTKENDLFEASLNTGEPYYQDSWEEDAKYNKSNNKYSQDYYQYDNSQKGNYYGDHYGGYNYYQGSEGNDGKNTKNNTNGYKGTKQSKKNFQSKSDYNSDIALKRTVSNILKSKEKVKSYLSRNKVEAPELTMNLIDGLIEGSMECMICNDYIDRSIEIWECEKCFTIFHNKCIYDWIFKLNSNLTGKKNEILEYKWTCPHCSNNYQANADNLPIYNCYCKRFYEAQSQNNKNFDPNLIPHGCGLTCNTEVCKHIICTLPCHPGPHLACSITEKVQCFCEKTEKEVPCTSQNKKFNCNQVCGKLLNCKKHTCKVKCHEEECETFLKNKKCEDCIEESKTKFYSFLKQLESKISVECKQKLETLADGLSEFIFNGTFFCNVHQNEANTENNLQFLLRLVQISGGKLLENIKKFIPVCKQIVENSCDCKSKITKTECYRLNYQNDILKFLGLSDYKEKPMEKCTKVCKSFKNCKNHRCGRVCCELSGKIIRNFSMDDPEGYHLCLMTCGKKLNCGNHVCENYCHRGACKPCPNVIREGCISCDCGKTKIEAPFICGTEVTCKFPCNKPSKCEHKCKLLCHKGDCLPCDELTFKVCQCRKNVIQNIRCGDPNVPQCTAPCMEMLPCGVHFCQIKCHDHTEEFDINYFCMMPCNRDYQRCKHKCLKRCHGEEECNEVECETLVKITCKCRVASRNIKCGEYKKLIDNDSNYILPCADECAKQLRLKNIEKTFDDLLKFSEEKNRVFMRKLHSANSETTNTPVEDDLITLASNKFNDTKFENGLVQFAKKNIKLIIELETLVEKALKNLGQKIEFPKLEKKLFMPCCEFLNTYYNIKIDKIKKAGETWSKLVISDASQAILPKFRLSLIALLFKHRKFVLNPKLNIYHPFEMSIYIQNYRHSVGADEIENYILTLGSISKNDFYIDEVEGGKCYVHFFNLEQGKKVFYKIKHKSSMFQEAYDIYHHLKEDLRMDQLYSYLKNEAYFNILFYLDENVNEEDKKVIEEADRVEGKADADGFIQIKKGKKPK